MNWSKTAIAITITLCITLSSLPSFSAEEKPESSTGETSSTNSLPEGFVLDEPSKPSRKDSATPGNIFDQFDNNLAEPRRTPVNLFEEKVKLHRKAAEQGDAGAQFNLGQIYFNGEIVKRDYAEAVKWWRKAAQQGHAGAQTNLDRMNKKPRSELFKLILLWLPPIFIATVFVAAWYTVIKQKHKGIQRLFIVLGTLGGYTATYSKFIGLSRRTEPYDIERLIVGLICGALLIILGSAILWVLNGFKIERK